MLSLKEKGQIPLEVIIITVVIAGLLLLVIVTTTNRNVETGQILTTRKNAIQCNTIASTIARMNNNKATTQETLNLETETMFRRVEGKTGGINIGDASCSYVGSVAMEMGEKDSYPDGTGEDGTDDGTAGWYAPWPYGAWWPSYAGRDAT